MFSKPSYWVHVEFGSTPLCHSLVTAVHDFLEGSYANHSTASALEGFLDS